MQPLSKSKLAQAIFLITSVQSAQNVFAQEEAFDGEIAIKEIVVAGSYRESLRNALNIKRNSAGSVDSIIAEDIGDFPDNNLAEALQRIPGVNIDRQGGEGKTISVRGLSPEFSRVRLNGMEVIAAGYDNRDRAFDFNIFASELFSRIDVKKTQDAETEEGSLGATVELHTGRPLEADGNNFVLNLSGGYNELSSDVDPRISGLINLQNDDATIGWSFSVAYSTRNLAQEGHNTGRWEANNNSGTNRWANSGDLSEFVNNAFHPRYPRQLDRNIEFDRLGLTNTLQWKITDNSTLTFDMLNAAFTYKQNEYTLTPISLSRTDATGRAETTVGLHEYVAVNNTLVYAELSGVDTRSENALIEADTTFNQYSLTLNHEFNDSFRMKALLGASNSSTDTEERNIILESFNQDFSYDYRGNENSPRLSFGFDLTDPNNWQISELRDRPEETEDSYLSGQVDFIWDLEEVFTLKAGASYKEFSFDNYSARRDTEVLEASGTEISVPDGCDLTLDDLDVISSLGSNYGASNGHTYFLPDIGAVADHTGFLTNSTCFPLNARVGDDRSLDESDTGVYVQADFHKEIGDVRVSGNVGLRYVATEQTARGYAAIDEASAVEEKIVSSKYNDTLPSINLSVEPVDELFFRASWSKVMSRPPLASITPHALLDGFNRTYTTGNPELDPYRATAIDLSVEWYFLNEALVSFAYFEKDIDSFTASASEQVTWDELNLPDSALDNLPASTTDIFTRSTTVNGDGGTLDGWELQFQTAFEFGPDWVRDFGIKANYTSVNSRVNNGSAENPVWARLNGQSDSSVNGTLWYENDKGIQGRISYTYRSDYQTRFNSRLGSGYGSDITDDVAVVDAAFSYLVNKNLKISLDMLNLTDEAETSLLGSYSLLETTLKSGRQYYLSAQFSF